MKRNRALYVSLCGTMTALATVLLYLGGVLPMFSYALPALAGLTLIPIVAELRVTWAWPVYAASSLLGLLLAPDKDTVLLYVLFLGYYPAVKAILEKHIHQTIPCVCCKLAIFNAAAVVAFWLSISLLKVPKTAFSIGTLYLPWALLLAANVVFLLYDYAASGVVWFYYRRLHPILQSWFSSR